MTQEEKAKAYDEALERTSKLIDEGCLNKMTGEFIFPELKESEDERIRKAIIEGLREMKSSFHTISSIKIDDAIAWLEKQGEQKPAEYNRETSTDLRDIVDNEANAIWEEESTDGCHLVIDSFNMFYGICMQIAEAVVDYKKPAWGEEDKARFESCIKLLQTSDGYDTINVKWLKSLKYRYTWKPSEEQMNTLEQWLKDNQYKGDARYCYPIFELLYQDLKKLKE